MRLTDLEALKDSAAAALLREAALDFTEKSIATVEGKSGAAAVAVDRLDQFRRDIGGTSLKAWADKPDSELTRELLVLARDLVRAV